MTIASVCMYIEAEKTKSQEERETFTTAELGTFERSVRTKEFKQSSGRVDGGDLKPLPINRKNQTVVDSWFRLLHFSTTTQSSASFISPFNSYHHSIDTNTQDRI